MVSPFSRTKVLTVLIGGVLVSATSPAQALTQTAPAIRPAAAPAAYQTDGMPELSAGPGNFDRVHGMDRRLGHETSGIVASSRDPRVVFTVDDRRGNDFIGVARTDGDFVDRVQVRGMSTHNAEALASGPCRPGWGIRCLYVGDIGNNRGRDRALSVWRLLEPDPRNLPRHAVLAERLQYWYPDRVYDAEAMIVDEQARVIVITKRPAPGRSQAVRRIYVGGPYGGRLTYVGSLSLPEPQHPRRYLRWGNLVTDASAVDGKVLILTYDQAVLFTAPGPGHDLLDFPNWPMTQWPVTRFRAAEASALVRSGSDAGVFVVAGEGFHGQKGQIGVLSRD